MSDSREAPDTPTSGNATTELHDAPAPRVATTQTSNLSLSSPELTNDLRSLSYHALTSGLCALIPVPFVDDWAVALVRRHKTRELLANASVIADGAAVKVLAQGAAPATWNGRFVGCLLSTLLWPIRFLYKLLIKKLLRKFIFVLAIKDAVDTFSRTFHDTFLLRHALRRGVLPRQVDVEAARPVRGAIEAVRSSVDHRPLERSLRTIVGSGRSTVLGIVRRLSRGLRALGRRGRRDERRVQREIARDTEGLEPMVNEIVSELDSRRGYLRTLEARLDQQLRA